MHFSQKLLRREKNRSLRLHSLIYAQHHGPESLGSDRSQVRCYQGRDRRDRQRQFHLSASKLRDQRAHRRRLVIRTKRTGDSGNNTVIRQAGNTETVNGGTAGH
jgi:hypothetical protein